MLNHFPHVQTQQQSELSSSLSARLSELEATTKQQLPALQSQLDTARSDLDALTNQHAAFLAQQSAEQQTHQQAFQTHLDELATRLSAQQAATEKLNHGLLALAENQRNDWRTALEAGLSAPLDSELKAMVEEAMQSERARVRRMVEDEVFSNHVSHVSFLFVHPSAIFYLYRLFMTNQIAQALEVHNSDNSREVDFALYASGGAILDRSETFDLHSGHSLLDRVGGILLSMHDEPRHFPIEVNFKSERMNLCFCL